MKGFDAVPLWGGEVIYDNSVESELLDALYEFGEAAGNGEDLDTSRNLPPFPLPHTSLQPDQAELTYTQLCNLTAPSLHQGHPTPPLLPTLRTSSSTQPTSRTHQS